MWRRPVSWELQKYYAVSRLVREGKTGKEIPKPLRLEFLEKFLANSLALSDAEDKTSEPLNRRGIVD